MGKIMHLTYSSNLAGLCEVNSSFDTGVLRVAYANANRNGSFISKEAYERSIKTIYNVPIVCNYNREEDSIGGHDCELVRSGDGDLKIVNVTTPVGVVPESASYYWESVEEEDGSIHEYLCVDVLLWKRQEAYSKIKRDGITSESMEITVKDGRFNKNLGLYVISDFEFTALCLLGDGIEPCFEQAALETFSHTEFKERMEEMMADLRSSLPLINTQNNGIDIENEIFAKGGNEKLEEKLALIEEFGMSIDELDFAIDDYSLEELREKLEGMKFDEDTTGGETADGTGDPETGSGEGGNSEAGGSETGGAEGGSNTGSDGTGSGNGGNDPAPEDPDDDIPDGINRNPTHTDKYELNAQISEGIYEAVAKCDEVVEMPWGSEPRYGVVDFDTDKGEIYVVDCTNWHIYALSYSMNGDNVCIDWSCKKRMKCAYVEYDEGAETPEAFSHFEEKYQEKINELNQFKLSVEEKEAQAERDEVIAKFADLEGVEAFEAVKEHSAEYSAEALEEKCFAIRGRTVKFSAEPKAPKIKVENTNINDDPNEPYGGLFVRYGIVGK